MIAWELKRSAKEASKQTGRIVLQRYYLQQLTDAGGYGVFVYPENFEEELGKLAP